MTTPRPKKPTKPRQTREVESLLAGDSILEKLLNQIPQEKREFVLLLLNELGIPKDDPSLPLLIALEYYVNLLEDIPNAMETSADKALKQSLEQYAAIQERLTGTVEEIDALRVQWFNDTEQLFRNLKQAFDAAKRKAIQDYDIALAQVNRQRMTQANEQWELFQFDLGRQLNRQGFLHSLGAMLAASLVIAPLAGWIGWQLHYQQLFGREDGLFFLKMSAFRDNRQRLQRCRQTVQQNGGKCTFWIERD